MGVYIPNIEKPKGCWLCTFQIVDPEGGANGCVLDHSIQSADWNEDAVDDCPLIEIPTGTCRLVEEFYPGELKAKQPVGSFIMYRSADEDSGRFILKVED